MDLQPIFDIPEICHQHGIKHAVISPGSRNAALTLAFVRHPMIQCLSVPDERSAAFIGLGIALKTKVPTVLICTSGSAGLNYAPAVAEAFFNQVPLLILTADRPPELIDKRDGQTIYQDYLYGKHAKAYFDYPSLTAVGLSVAHECINDAILECKGDAPGPVQVNIPFREPFYPEEEISVTPLDQIQVEELPKYHAKITSSDTEEIKNFKRVLIIAGQGNYSDLEKQTLGKTLSAAKIPLIADVMSNCHEVENVVLHHDLFLKFELEDDLKPDLIITFGLSVISKNLKIFLKYHQDIQHWHITPNSDLPDTYNHLTGNIDADLLSFLETADLDSQPALQEQQDFWALWQQRNNTTEETIRAYKPIEFNETSIYRQIIKMLPEHIDLHLANSMAVRYANTIGLKHKQHIEVYCNRGTSGIDGSSSTAIGACIASKKDTILMSGDVAFFYDRNAFWHNHVPDNFHVILFNNHGGNIFRMIDGPAAQPELKEFFETNQKSKAVQLAQEFDFDYYPCHTYGEVEMAMSKLTAGSGKKILEIFTDAETNKTTYKELFKKVKEMNASH
ncbi:MAG: 2-succinyl-5-enolpyruvyl-6-hydroxy-3-cyclohexene-1-carboxylic-acid synthase [Reichenbachiella sp.]